MQFCFYPRLESGCTQVSHYPHLGRAALGTLVRQAHSSRDLIQQLHRLIDAERERNVKLVEEVQRLEEELADNAEPVVDDIAKKLASSEGSVHADETYWTTDGVRSYFWVHGDEKYIHFQYDTSRAGQVSRNILGNDFTGTLVTDCYSGYAASVARSTRCRRPGCVRNWCACKRAT